MNHKYDESFEELRTRQEKERKEAVFRHDKESKMNIAQCYRAIFMFYQKQAEKENSKELRDLVESLRPGLDLINLIESRAK